MNITYLKIILFSLLNSHLAPIWKKVSSLATDQLEIRVKCSNHWCHDVPLAANEVVMMSAGSLALIHAKWGEETKEERRQMNEAWRRLEWDYRSFHPFIFLFPSITYATSNRISSAQPHEIFCLWSLWPVLLMMGRSLSALYLIIPCDSSNDFISLHGTSEVTKSCRVSAAQKKEWPCCCFTWFPVDVDHLSQSGILAQMVHTSITGSESPPPVQMLLF